MAKPASTLLLSLLLAPYPGAQNPDYHGAARRAGAWLEAVSLQSELGTVWPMEPDRPKAIIANLYSGTPGVVLFYLELYAWTLDDKQLKQATSGADYLLALTTMKPSPWNSGLYTGSAGIGFVLHEVYKATGDEKYEQGARRLVRELIAGARPAGAGVEWNDVTDIISGSSGIGLFLLYAAREMAMPEARETAAAAGDRLIEEGKPEHQGQKWAMSEQFPRLMPNFSHGTAGVAYFLAGLYQETGEKRFLDASMAGARYLEAIADGTGDSCLIFHDEPDGKQLYYLSWCHGPAGTARLFYRLYRITRDEEWMVWVRKLAAGIRQSGIPERSTAGYWNNVSQCCGAAGVAEFFMDLHRVTQDRSYLEFALKMAQAVLEKGTNVPESAGGMKWIQAEHRAQPELLAAQTGYMQGAAGIGMMFLHLDALLKGKRGSIVFPDSPF